MTAAFTEEQGKALEAALLAQARRGELITYAALAADLALAPPHRIHRLTLALEDRVRDDHRAGRPLLSALAVGKSGIPGRGFFQLLSDLGRYAGADHGSDAEAQHRRELADALRYWGSGESD